MLNRLLLLGVSERVVAPPADFPLLPAPVTLATSPFPRPSTSPSFSPNATPFSASAACSAIASVAQKLPYVPSPHLLLLIRTVRADSTPPCPPKVAKFVARLTLLDHGLLTASLELNRLHPHINPKGKDKQREASVEAEAEELLGELEDKPDETEEQFIQRIADFVNNAMKGKKGSLGRDGYKDGLVYDERKKTIAEFTKMGHKKCQKCKA
jgi:hypothetical protein